MARSRGSAARRRHGSWWQGRPPGRARAWLLSAVLATAGTLGALALALLLLSGRAEAAATLNADLVGPGVSVTGATTVDLASLTCDAALSALQGDAASNTTVALPISPTGYAQIDATQLTLASDASSNCTTLTLQGSTTLFGQAAQILVVGDWTTSTPTFSVVIQRQNVDLSNLVTATSAGPGLTFSQALVAFTSSTSGTTLSASSLPGTAGTFLGSDLTIAGSGVTLRGQLAGTGDVASGLSQLGIDPSTVVLQGSLTASTSFSTSAPPAVSTGLDLSASFTPAVATPSWLSLSGPLTLSLQGGGGTWTASASGSATVTLPQSSPATASADFTITKDPTGVTVGMTASLGTVTAPFGQSWLTLDKASVSWSVGAATAASLDATATVDGSSFTVTASLDKAAGASVELSTTATLDAATLAGDLGLPSFPSGTPDLSVSGLDVAVQVPGSGSATIAITGTATLTVNSTPYSADVLVRAQLGSSSSLLVAARPTSQLTLSDLLGHSISPDFTLPNVAVVFSTSDVKLPSTQLDGPTLAYFQPILCDQSDPTCAFTLDAPAGVGISAAVSLPSSLQTMVCNLVGTSGTNCTNLLTGPVRIDGQIPLFGNTTTSLTVSLPTVNVDAGPVQQLRLHFSIAASTSGTFSLDAGGDLILLAPGTGGAATCPSSITSVPSGDVCLDLSVNGSVAVSSGTASVNLTGQLTGGNAQSGWTLPSPVSWATLNDLVIQIGVTSADGGGVTLGARGAVQIGSKDLSLAVDLEVMAEPPWVNLLGFEAGSHAGLSLSDLVSLYNDVSGQHVSTSSLPPVALQNLYFSYSQVNDSALCLSQGLYLSGDLVLTNPGATPVGGSAPSGQACGTPSRSSACSSDSGSCLASVYLSISSDGIKGKGHIAGWSAGPLSFDPTDLSFTLDSSEVQIDISGGGTLLDPVLYPSEGQSAPVWGAGNLTLDVGTQNLALDGSVTVAGLSGSVHANGSFDLSNPGFDLTDWFNTLKGDFQQAGQQINGAITTVSTASQTWYNTYVAPGADQVFSAISGAFQSLGNPSTAWQDVISAYNSISSKIDSVNSGLDSAGLGWLDIPTTAIFQDTLDGITFNGWTPCGIFGCVTIVPGFHIPGLCDYDPAIEGSPVCVAPFSDIVTTAQRQFADPSVNASLQAAGLTAPPGASDGSMVTKIAQLDPPAPTQISCAMTTVNYAAGTVSPTTLEVSSLGHDVTFAGPQPAQLDSALTKGAHGLSQDTLNGLYSGTNTGTCTAAPTPAPSVSVSLDHSWVNEGGTVKATGYVENSPATTVTLDWGDGTTSTATVANGQYAASHTYADEQGANGTASPYTVTATVTGITPATTTIAVLDTPLVLSSFSVSPSPVNLMTPVTAKGTLAAPEPGETETATITWGDATAPTKVTVGVDGTFTATHTYQVLDPTGAPSQQEPVSVKIAEADGTGTGGATSVTVNDVAPKGTTLTPTTGATVDGATVFTHAGTAVTWMAQALHISPEAVLTFQTNWADGTAPTVLTASSPSGPADPATGWFPYSAAASGFSHTFPGACLDLVTTDVTDANTLSAPTLTTPVVVTAPLGARPQGSGYFLGQLRIALWLAAHPNFPGDFGREHHVQLTADQLTCYVRIAQYLSPALGSDPSLEAAAQLLEPHWFRFDPQGRVAAELKLHLFTALLNFANGNGDWSQYSAAVTAANQALASGSDRAMFQAIEGLDQATFEDHGDH